MATLCMPEDVLAWLNGSRDFAAGLALLRKYGASNFILKLLEDGPGPFNTVKLMIEMGKIKGTQPTVPAVAAPGEDKSAVGSTATATSPYKPDHNLEKSLRIKKLIKDLFKEITHLRGKLCILPEGEELFAIAKLVITKDLKKQDMFDHLHYFEKNGNWFDELAENVQQDFDPTDSAQLEQKIKNLMASRSKASKMLKRPLPVGVKDHHESRVAEFTRLIEKYKQYRVSNI